MDEQRAPTPTAAEIIEVFRRRYRQLLDRTVVYPRTRWAVFITAAAIYGVRVYYLKGWFIVTYGLGIYLLNFLIGFLTPQVCFLNCDAVNCTNDGVNVVRYCTLCTIRTAEVTVPLHTHPPTGRPRFGWTITSI